MARPFQESVTRESLPHVEAQLASQPGRDRRRGRIGPHRHDRGRAADQGRRHGAKEVVATAISVPDGEVAAILGVTRDRRERKRAEEALRESEERYRSLFEQSPIGIYRTTPDGRILLANPALLHMLGYDSSEELIARNLETTGFEPEYPRERFKEIARARQRGQGLRNPLDDESRATGCGSSRTRGRSASSDGRILYYEGTVEDITARRRAEEAQHRLAAAVEQGDEAVVITDPNGTIEYVNPAFQRITGYSATRRSARRRGCSTAAVTTPRSTRRCGTPSRRARCGPAI